MIYIAGDTHIPIDLNKLDVKNFPEQNSLTKNDYVIICGDFGGVWNNSKEEIYWRNWFNDKNFTTLFVDGNHENFNLLYQHSVEWWNNGKVHFISDSIIHLMRGQIFEINGLKIFTMGGAESIDKYRRTEHVSWWRDELPNSREYRDALKNLDNNNWNVDYVITHTGPRNVLNNIALIQDNNQLNDFLEILYGRLQYKHWYFGHYHRDKIIDKKHTVVYNNVIKLLD